MKLRMLGLAAVLLAALGVTAGVAASPAAAVHAPRTTQQAVEAAPNPTFKHECTNFGDVVQGYRAGMCGDLINFVNSIGWPAIRSRGQFFCQRASDGVIVQCAGIDGHIVLEDLDDGENYIQLNWIKCGARLGEAACPAGRFSGLTHGFECNRNHDFQVTVSAEIWLPGSGSKTPHTSFRVTGRSLCPFV